MRIYSNILQYIYTKLRLRFYHEQYCNIHNGFIEESQKITKLCTENDELTISKYFITEIGKLTILKYSLCAEYNKLTILNYSLCSKCKRIFCVKY